MERGGQTGYRSIWANASLIRLIAGASMVIALLLPAMSAGATAVNGDGWEFQTTACSDNIGVATGNYEIGPGVPPLGSGSFELSLPASQSYPQLQNADFDGTPLSQLSSLSYSTYVNANGNQEAAPFILFEVDQNGDGTVDDQLVYQPAAQGSAIPGKTWQTWDALTGKWWSIQGVAGMGVGTAGKSLSDYLAAYPGATITNAGLRVAAGCVGGGWSGFVGNFDALVIGVNSSNTIYDFEPDGVHITSPSTGDNHPGLPTFNGLSPAPFSTVAPGSVTISSLVSSDDPISSVAVTVNGQDVTPTFTGTLATDKTVTASVSQSLGAGTYTVIMTATDSNGDTFSSQWDFVVSSNQGDNEWFYADGTPKTDQINATMTSLVQAFRWHLFGQTWDGQDHPEIPTHASTVTNAAALSNWVNGTTFDENATNATLTSLVQAFRWHFWGVSWDGSAHPEMPTHASVVLPPQSISAWFNADGTPIPDNISATLQSLVQAFRWHFWGNSWDGQHHFTDMPTHAY